MRQLIRVLLVALPKVAMSRAFGVIGRIPVPRPLRPLVYGAYARLCGADLGEMSGGLRDYRSLQDFFQRPLAEGRRPVDRASPLVWPNDGRVVSAGPIADGRLEQIKGVDYTLEELLVDRQLAAAFLGGSQATIYLAPGDYHRVHAPLRGELVDRIHLPGTLFPTNPPAVHSIPRLYPRNERVVHRFRRADGGTAALVMVGALNVGDIRPSCPHPGAVQPGDEIARFGLGSTTILLLPADGPAIAAAPRQRVRMGAAIPLRAARPGSGRTDPDPTAQRSHP